MGLNIKRPETEANIRKLAAWTGESLTDAIDRAVSEKLARLDAQAARNRPAETAEQILEKLRPLQEAVAAERRSRGDTRTSKELMDELYDEHGLPI
ncbi:MAG TPA: type II toxin-antitoxin system VapB family antitoxin [Rhizomicrobium sp.]|nr:type II toxin-antitoxin system VapB family antitoxin [Rhizomicrobium sp.]